MSRIGWAVLLVLGGIGDARTAEPDARAIDDAVREVMRVWEVPGLAVVVVRGDRVVLLNGYGRRELGKPAPVTADTLFPLASCTKAFTSAAIAALVDDGAVGWDDPVRKHVPAFHLSDPNADALVTVTDLLTHRTGVGGHDFLWYRAPWDQDESIRRAGRLPPYGPFRATFAYQSIMYMAAGRAVDRHSPDGWAGFVRRRFLDPLGMTATRLSGPEVAKATDRASGHRRGRAGTVAACEPYPTAEPNAAGSAFTTARDLGAWLRFHLGDGTWRGKRLLSAANLAQTHAPHTIIPLVGEAKAMHPETVTLTYAMGWLSQDYRGVRLLQHGGWIDGFRAHLALVPDHGIGIGLMCNLHATKMNAALTNRLLDLLLGFPERDWNAYFGEVVKAEERATDEADRQRVAGRRPDEKPTKPLASFAGTYEHPAYGTCVVKLADGHLVWEWSSFRCELRPYRGDTFELSNQYLGDQLAEFGSGLKVLGVEFAKR